MDAGPSGRTGADGAHEAATAAVSTCHVDGQGPLVALLLSFQLPPSTYATMLIRELTKQSSASKYQKGLSAAAAFGAAGAPGLVEEAAGSDATAEARASVEGLQGAAPVQAMAVDATELAGQVAASEHAL